ncbi:MAG: spoIIIJ-associated protein [Parcubacteria group bacterium Licking1014_1]|nr:MAG: spoIIIJ-associated protein [Parcubacteria group bacterium Licking1014_1]
MLDQSDLKKIKELSEEFFQKTTILVSYIEAVLPIGDVVDLSVKLEEPQILIGEKGQTLFEIQRLLKIILNKKLQKVFYLNLDINDYKKKKIEYLKGIAKDMADEVVLTKEKKVLYSMPAYERRIIHTELAKRQDVIAESQGEDPDRQIVISPK